mmetsp:Transcript_28893/g.65332  ORF Transcript_28893/g.65332 Transcript_28893/m.65332 type:complete len:488 (+) Transcript_28893:54-1517(+)
MAKYLPSTFESSSEDGPYASLLRRLPSGPVSGQTTLHLGTVCALVGLQTAVFAGASWLCLGSSSTSVVRDLHEENEHLHQDNERLHKKTSWLREDNHWLGQDIGRLKGRLRQKPDGKKEAHPYEAITATVGHQEPEMYGRIPEKTIWSYWFNKESCPSSRNCTLPPHLQLCIESVKRNRGSFEHRLLHIDDVERYVSMYDLPFKWPVFSPQHMKDSLMNALLARYGGVALDVSTVLLRPLDDYWEEMIAKRATFRGYMYRINGLPWRHPEASAVWFLMSRREGIFGAAVRNQVEGMGDKNTTYRVYRESYFALGDQTLLPILMMFNYSLPKCTDDHTVSVPHIECPEHEGPPWYKAVTGPARNDMGILLRDPRDGPQLPFACLHSSGWNISNDTEGIPHGDVRFPAGHALGGPMYKENCSSFKNCWESVFLRRYHAPPAPGEARMLSFVKLFMHGAELEGKSREELLANKDSFFFNWLKLAGVSGAH